MRERGPRRVLVIVGTYLRADRLRLFQDPAPSLTARVLWLCDPFWIAWTRRYWRWSGPPAPPACPARTIEAGARTELPGLLASAPGSAEVLHRWNRLPAVVHDCPVRRTAHR